MSCNGKSCLLGKEAIQAADFRENSCLEESPRLPNTMYWPMNTLGVIIKNRSDYVSGYVQTQKNILSSYGGMNMENKYSLSYYEQYAAFINRRYPFPFPDYVFEFIKLGENHKAYKD